MELQEEVVPFVSSGSYQSQMVGKGRRTKRLRLVMGTSSGGSFDSVVTQEEQDMADCLILLAHGGETFLQVPKTEEVSGKRKPSFEMGGAGRGAFSYECKTCSKAFQSFQALGGHRTSHTKPKLHETKNVANLENGNVSNCSVSLQPSTSSSNNNNHNNKSVVKATSSGNKVHQCSICGTAFSSGQALGGHMRRHRAVPLQVRAPVSSSMYSMGSDHQSASSFEVAGEIETQNFLSFDLNLPAGDIAESVENAAFHPLQMVVFSAHPHPIANCHY